MNSDYPLIADMQRRLQNLEERMARLDADHNADKQPAEGPTRYDWQTRKAVMEIGRILRGITLTSAQADDIRLMALGRIPLPGGSERHYQGEQQPAEVDDAVSLLMRCVPVLDLRVSEHNDGRRLRSAICQWLADRGYLGWLAAREAVQDPTKRLTLADEVNALRRRVAELEQPNCKAYEERS